ncbi:hypothetical protein VWU04_22635, partial [Xanthomonas citri pv. citri]
QCGDQDWIALPLYQFPLKRADARLDRLHLAISDFLMVGLEFKQAQEVIQQEAMLVVVEPPSARAAALLGDLKVDIFAVLERMWAQDDRMGLVVYKPDRLDQ